MGDAAVTEFCSDYSFLNDTRVMARIRRALIIECLYAMVENRRFTYTDILVV